jgi:small GTP-binding protein
MASRMSKTTILEKLMNRTFKEEGQPTIGVEFKSFAIQAEGENVKLQTGETAGQERFRSVPMAYFRNAIGAVLVFDLAMHHRPTNRTRVASRTRTLPSLATRRTSSAAARCPRARRKKPPDGITSSIWRRL